MILTDREIASFLMSEQLVITPRPANDYFSATSVDLTLRNKFTTWIPTAGMTLNPGADGFSYNSLKHLQNTEEKQNFLLNPKAFVLAWTEEYVSIPTRSRLAARVEGKSTLARLGVSVHITAPTIHSGFEGPIQLEMFNFGPHTIVLNAGMRVCQLIFELTLGTPEKGYDGSFMNQSP